MVIRSSCNVAGNCRSGRVKKYFGNNIFLSQQFVSCCSPYAFSPASRDDRIFYLIILFWTQFWVRQKFGCACSKTNGCHNTVVFAVAIRDAPPMFLGIFTARSGHTHHFTVSGGSAVSLSSSRHQCYQVYEDAGNVTILLVDQ